MKTIWDAFAFAVRAHDKTPPRRGGDPSILHPIRVAYGVGILNMNSDTVSGSECVRRMEECGYTQAALLHDVIEDTNTTLKDLKDYGFGSQVTALVKVLTRREDQTYADYIEDIVAFDLDSGWTGACFIKKFDIEDNYPTATDSMKKRYDKALKRLDPDSFYRSSLK